MSVHAIDPMSRANLILRVLVLLLLTGFPSVDSHGSITAAVQIDLWAAS